MGDSPKCVKSKRRRKRGERERLNDGDNNGQATHGTTQARMAHASRLGQKKVIFRTFFSAFYGQRSVTAAWATRSPWSIIVVFLLVQAAVTERWP